MTLSDFWVQRPSSSSRTGFDLKINMASSSSLGILLLYHICGTVLFAYTLYHHLQVKAPNHRVYGGKFKFLTFLNVVSLNYLLHLAMFICPFFHTSVLKYLFKDSHIPSYSSWSSVCVRSSFIVYPPVPLSGFSYVRNSFVSHRRYKQLPSLSDSWKQRNKEQE